MIRTLVWRGEAIREVQKIYNWYELRSKGMGEAFLVEVDDHLDFILQHPEGPAKWRSKYRRSTLKQFPYQIVYRLERRAIVIYSVFPYQA